MATNTEAWKRITEQVKIHWVVAPRGGWCTETSWVGLKMKTHVPWDDTPCWLLNSYNSTRCNIPGPLNLQSDCCETFKYNMGLHILIEYWVGDFLYCRCLDMHSYQNFVIKCNFNRIGWQVAYLKLEESIKEISHKRPLKMPANLFSGWESKTKATVSQCFVVLWRK